MNQNKLTRHMALWVVIINNNACDNHLIFLVGTVRCFRTCYNHRTTFLTHDFGSVRRYNLK